MAPPKVVVGAAVLLWGHAAAVAAAAAPIVMFGDFGELHICSASIIRVVHRPNSAPVEKSSLIVKADCGGAPFDVTMKGDIVRVQTASLIVEAKPDGNVTFLDKATQAVLLSERSHSFMPSQDMANRSMKDAFQVEQTWHEAGPDEALWGGGGYQNGFLNYKNAPLQMLQFNTEAVVPFFTSSAGYGLLWDNYAWTFLNPPEQALVPPATGGLTGAVTFTPAVDGDHFFYVGQPFPQPREGPRFGTHNMDNASVKLTGPGGEVIYVISWDNLSNRPSSLTGRAPSLKKGTEYKVEYAWNDVQATGLYVQGPGYGRTTLRSFLGKMVDYYFVQGGGDAAIAGYRELTGAAPIYARWVYGFWQCKEHYDTQDHVLEAARGLRNHSIPFDAIVQDWLYWGPLKWGPHWYNGTYPDPASMVKELHSMDVHFMVSVWSKFDKETTFWQQMNSKGWILGSSEYYDAWNPDARELFYGFANKADFSIGVDALWLDATEPEGFPNVNGETFLGSGNALMNSYSLMTTEAIADGLRRDYPDAQGARVFSLTRSSFAGQQRTGASVWSGDISGAWDSLRRQIASSLNYQMSGIPYWSEDIGGFFRPVKQYTQPDYQDMLTRWFQFGTFTPIFRVHGAHSATELWNYLPTTMENINASAISLRYRLLPYIYSGFARVEEEGYTMQRALMLDFPADQRTWDIADEFMWGDALLVTPFYVPASNGTNTTTRTAYLPQAAKWVNFHTGKQQAAGDVEVSFELSEAPVFARAGSILPLGPLVQHSGERLSEPVEVRVYPGADATFTLFEDDGVSLAYRHGNATRTLFSWSEATQELTIEPSRQNSAASTMRTFSVVFVSPGHCVGVSPCKPDIAIPYEGQRVVLKRNPPPPTRPLTHPPPPTATHPTPHQGVWWV